MYFITTVSIHFAYIKKCEDQSPETKTKKITNYVHFSSGSENFFSSLVAVDLYGKANKTQMSSARCTSSKSREKKPHTTIPMIRHSFLVNYIFFVIFALG